MREKIGEDPNPIFCSNLLNTTTFNLKYKKEKNY
jgi:hypothetical protein